MWGVLQQLSLDINSKLDIESYLSETKLIDYLVNRLFLPGEEVQHHTFGKCLKYQLNLAGLDLPFMSPQMVFYSYVCKVAQETGRYKSCKDIYDYDDISKVSHLNKLIKVKQI